MTGSKVLKPISKVNDFQTNGSSLEEKERSSVDVLELLWRD
jgi:hypothetical protein